MLEVYDQLPQPVNAGSEDGCHNRVPDKVFLKHVLPDQTQISVCEYTGDCPDLEGKLKDLKIKVFEILKAL